MCRDYVLWGQCYIFLYTTCTCCPKAAAGNWIALYVWGKTAKVVSATFQVKAKVKDGGNQAQLPSCCYLSYLLQEIFFFFILPLTNKVHLVPGHVVCKKTVIAHLSSSLFRNLLETITTARNYLFVSTVGVGTIQIQDTNNPYPKECII